MAVQQLRQGSYVRGEGDDSTSVIPRFHMASVQDHIASETAGRPIFREEERVEIILPGNPHTRPVHRVTDEHRQRWPEKYEAFRKGVDMAEDGTPLEEWPRLKRSQVNELKALGFTTVEQVADMNDLAMQRLSLGGRMVRDLAKAYLDESARHALTERLAADNERKDAEIAQLNRKVEEMSTLLQSVHGQLVALQNAPSPLATAVPAEAMAAIQVPPPPVATSSLDDLAKPGRGRPPKAKAA